MQFIAIISHFLDILSAEKKKKFYPEIRAKDLI